MKKLLIPALLLLLIGPLARADTFFHDVIANSPALPPPYLSTDGVPAARGGVIYHLPPSVFSPSGGTVYITNPPGISSPAYSTPWTILRPDLATQSTGGTIANGLDSVMADATVKQNWSIRLDGPGGSNGSNTWIGVNGTLAIMNLRNQAFQSFGASIYGGSTAVISDAVTIGSCVEGSIAFIGSQIGLGSTTTYSDATLLIAPLTPVLPENITGFFCPLYTGNVSFGGLSGEAAIAFDVATGSVSESYIDILEANGGGGAGPLANSAVEIRNPAATKGFFNNEVHGHYLHNSKSTVLRIGTSTTNQANIRANLWDLSRVELGTAATTGISTYESFGRYRIGSVANGAVAGGTGLQFESGATYNKGTVLVEDQSGSGWTNGVVFAAGSDWNDIDVYTRGTVTNPVVDTAAAHNSWSVNGEVIEKWQGTSEWNYAAPTSCAANGGATCAVQASSTNANGKLSITVASPTTVTLTFSHTYKGSVFCSPMSATTTQVGAQTATGTGSVTWTFGTTPGVSTVSYTGCHGEGT